MPIKQGKGKAFFILYQIFNQKKLFSAECGVWNAEFLWQNSINIKKPTLN